MVQEYQRRRREDGDGAAVATSPRPSQCVNATSLALMVLDSPFLSAQNVLHHLLCEAANLAQRYVPVPAQRFVLDPALNCFHQR